MYYTYSQYPSKKGENTLIETQSLNFLAADGFNNIWL